MIGPAFFGYEDAIVDAFRAAGAQAKFIDERVWNRSFVRAVARVSPTLLHMFTSLHFRRVAARFRRTGVDLVLVVKGEAIPVAFLRSIVRDHPDALLVFYAYDSVRTSAVYPQQADLFDHAYSFDRDDVEAYPGLRYKPLFFTAEFEPGAPHAERTLDVAFVGTVSPTRYAVLRAIASHFPRAHTYFYVPARWYLRLRRAVSPEYRYVDVADVRTEKLSRAQVAERFRSARVVLDHQKPGQSGLTMRTFEALASGAALVTTNRRTLDEDLSADDRVAVITVDDVEGAVAAVRELLGRDLDGRRPPGFDRFSVGAWVEELLLLSRDDAVPADDRTVSARQPDMRAP
ncbi:glycosyltransferase family protein [Cellulomonas sp. P5_C5]